MGKLSWLIYNGGYVEHDGGVTLARRHRRTGVVQTKIADGWKELPSAGKFVPDPWWVTAATAFLWCLVVVPPAVCLLHLDLWLTLYTGTMSAIIYRRL